MCATSLSSCRERYILLCGHFSIGKLSAQTAEVINIGNECVKLCFCIAEQKFAMTNTNLTNEKLCDILIKVCIYIQMRSPLPMT